MFKFCKFTFFLLIISFLGLRSELLVMIDPAGDANKTGRKIGDSFERTVAFKMAGALKKKLHDYYGIRGVLTRYPGEVIEDLQNASFAGRLNVDFYLSLHVFGHELVKPTILLYNLVYNPMVDFALRSVSPGKFIPVQQAHFFNIKKTLFYGRCIKNHLTQEHYIKNFDFYGVFGIPIKSLVGVIAPALAIEVGISNEDQWENLINPIIESLSFLSW